MGISIRTMSRAYNPQREELYTIKDDFGPGVHQGERVQGIQSTMKLTNTAIGHPEIRYKDRLTVADVYKMGDELKIHLICPRCTNNLSISNKNKQVDYDLDSNTLSIEPFECTWEITSELLGSQRSFGMSLCRWRVAIDNNIAKDA